MAPRDEKSPSADQVSGVLQAPVSVEVSAKKEDPFAARSSEQPFPRVFSKAKLMVEEFLADPACRLKKSDYATEPLSFRSPFAAMMVAQREIERRSKLTAQWEFSRFPSIGFCKVQDGQRDFFFIFDAEATLSNAETWDVPVAVWLRESPLGMDVMDFQFGDASQ
jgi:hypothetical protein